MDTPKFSPATNFQGAGSTTDSTYTNFGLTVYKNYDTALGRNMYLSEHIGTMVEMGNGAHYYARGPYVATYAKAQVTIDLTKVKAVTKNRRVACLSLCVVGAKGSCDMGIETEDGTNWFGMSYSGVLTKDGDYKTGSYASPKSVTIIITPTRENGKDYVTGTFVFTKSDGTTETTSLRRCGTAGALFVLSGTAPLVRFGRFMSLILLNEINKTTATDTADASSLTGGNFTSPKLYKANGTSVVWNKALMDYIWSVQGWNISILSVDATDSFSCAHSHYVY